MQLNNDAIKQLWITMVPETEQLNIYINAPFCFCQCRYCLYRGHQADANTIENYYKQYLIPQLYTYRDLFKRYSIGTIYFGGGTPNTMPISILKEIIYALDNTYTNAHARIIEINPAFVSNEYIEEIAKLNFTLVTFGVQTFDKDAIIKHRRGYVSPERIKELTAMIKNSGAWVSLDIMAYLQTYRNSDLENYLTQDIALSFTADIDFITIYPELNLINIDPSARQHFITFMQQFVLGTTINAYADDYTFKDNPRLIVRLIRNQYPYQMFMQDILPYYEDDFPYAKMNIIGFGDYYSSQEVISYSPRRFCYAEKYMDGQPQYDLKYRC